MIGTPSSPEVRDDDALTLPVYEEIARVEKKAVDLGKLRVATHTEAVEHVARAELHADRVDVQHVAINQPVLGDPPRIRTEGDVTIVPIFEEVMVVEKRLMLKEELHIRRVHTVETAETPITLRRQIATVDTLDSALDGASPAQAIR